MKAPIPQILNKVFLKLLSDYDDYQYGNKGDSLDPIIAEAITDAILGLHSQGVVIRGQSLGASHPHLADYWTIESLIEEE